MLGFYEVFIEYTPSSWAKRGQSAICAATTKLCLMLERVLVALAEGWPQGNTPAELGFTGKEIVSALKYFIKKSVGLDWTRENREKCELEAMKVCLQKQAAHIKRLEQVIASKHAAAKVANDELQCIKSFLSLHDIGMHDIGGIAPPDEALDHEASLPLAPLELLLPAPIFPLAMGACPRRLFGPRAAPVETAGDPAGTHAAGVEDSDDDSSECDPNMPALIDYVSTDTESDTESE